MTMHKALQSGYDADGVFFKTKGSRKELISIKDCSNCQNRMCTKYSQPRNANIMKIA